MAPTATHPPHVEVSKEDAAADDDELKEIVSPTQSEMDAAIEPEEEEEERESFGNKLQYILTLVGYAVGFGNIWRFPYLVQENGGVVFLIPYTMSLVFIGIPTFYLELAIGQRLRKGPIGCWNEISPYLGGIGLATGMICYIVALYYNTLLSWALSYFFDAFRSQLLYETCGLAVGEEDKNYCNVHPEKEECRRCDIAGSSQYYWFNRVLRASDGIETPGEFNGWMAGMLAIAWVIVWGILVKGLKAAGKVVYFTALFPYFVLLIFLCYGWTLPGMQEGYKHLFTPQWDKLGDGNIWKTAAAQIFFSLGLGFGCLVAFASYLKPNNNCYKDAVTIAIINCGTSCLAACTMFPYLGALGTSKFWECKQERLVKFVDRASLWNIIPALGGLQDYLHKTYNYADSDVIEALSKKLREPYNVLGLADSGNITTYTLDTGGTSYATSGFNITDIPNCEIGSFVKASASGTGFVFIVMAKAISSLPCPPVWAVIFFLMLITLGIDSAFGTVEGSVAAIMDLRIPRVKRWMATSAICGTLYLFSWMFTMGWSVYLQVYLDDFCANWGLLLVALFEAIGIAWVYGLPKFAKDIRLMTGVKPSFYFLICWKYISPILILVMLLYSFIETFVKWPMKYNKWDAEASKSMEAPYPGWVVAIGFLITFISMVGIPLVAILHFFRVDILKPEVPVDFPEEELKMEHHLDDNEIETSSLTKLMYWGSIGSDHSDKGKDTSSGSGIAVENVSLKDASGPGISEQKPHPPTN